MNAPITYSIGRDIHDNQPAQFTAADFDGLLADLDRKRAKTKATAGYLCGHSTVMRRWRMSADCFRW
jgi:hypothetical protein